MKIFSRIAVLVVLAVQSTAVLAAEPNKIGFVNAQRLLAESPQAQAAREILNDEFAPLERELVALGQEFQAKQEKLQRDIDVMSAEERRNAERDLQNDQRNLQRRQSEANEDLERRSNELTVGMQQELVAEIQRYASENGYDLIINEGVLYVSEGLDITDEILKGLQARFKTGE